jgi:predicted ArsR family transcriptional regulator
VTKQSPVEDPVRALALLDDPKRRRLYEFVAASDTPVGRDEAAAELGISRELAAFHLDRLVAAGLFDTQYRRLGGRRGPGAGRPAKLYRRVDRELAVSFPPRRYGRAADLMATALERLGGGSGAKVAAEVAREQGRAAGAAGRQKLGARPGRRRIVAGLLDLLRGADYQPQLDPSTGTLFLRNCPYHDLATDHRELTCGMNLAWAEGVIDGLGVPLRAELAPEAGRCCVVVHITPDGNGSTMGVESVPSAGGAYDH